MMIPSYISPKANTFMIFLGISLCLIQNLSTHLFSWDPNYQPLMEIPSKILCYIVVLLEVFSISLSYDLTLPMQLIMFPSTCMIHLQLTGTLSRESYSISKVPSTMVFTFDMPRHFLYMASLMLIGLVIHTIDTHSVALLSILVIILSLGAPRSSELSHDLVLNPSTRRVLPISPQR